MPFKTGRELKEFIGILSEREVGVITDREPSFFSTVRGVKHENGEQIVQFAEGVSYTRTDSALLWQLLKNNDEELVFYDEHDTSYELVKIELTDSLLTLFLNEY